MKHKAPAADLSGGKTSEDSLTPRRIRLAPEDARDLRSYLLLDVALGSTVSSEEFVRFLFPALNTDRMRSEAALRPGSRESGQMLHPVEICLRTAWLLIVRGQEAGRRQS